MPTLPLAPRSWPDSGNNLLRAVRLGASRLVSAHMHAGVAFGLAGSPDPASE